MKLVTFVSDGSEKIGVMTSALDGVVDLSAATGGSLGTMLGLI